MQAFTPVLSTVDGVITRLADLTDNPAYDYESWVVATTWLQTLFEVYLWYVTNH
jgi:hypothetical protein